MFNDKLELRLKLEPRFKTEETEYYKEEIFKVAMLYPFIELGHCISWYKPFGNCVLFEVLLPIIFQNNNDTDKNNIKILRKHRRKKINLISEKAFDYQSENWEIANIRLTGEISVFEGLSGNTVYNFNWLLNDKEFIPRGCLFYEPREINLLLKRGFSWLSKRYYMNELKQYFKL